MCPLGDKGLPLRGIATTSLFGVRLPIEWDSGTNGHHHPRIARKRRTFVHDRRLEHLYSSLWLRMLGRLLLQPVLVGLGRDIELGGEDQSLEVLVLSHIFLERVSYPIAVCVQGIIAILESSELSADGN